MVADATAALRYCVSAPIPKFPQPTQAVQGFRLFDDSSTLAFGGVPVSVNVEAWK